MGDTYGDRDGFIVVLAETMIKAGVSDTVEMFICFFKWCNYAC